MPDVFWGLLITMFLGLACAEAFDDPWKRRVDPADVCFSVVVAAIVLVMWVAIFLNWWRGE